MTSYKPHRVWIELEYPKNGNAEGHARAQLATQMLRRLGDPITGFWWNENQHRYCVSIDSAGGFMECADNGHWFNLETLGSTP
jgi:hypothetical protein